MSQTTQQQPQTFADVYRKVDHELTIRTAKVEELLPPLMKGQADRLIKRALLTFSRRPELHAVTPASFIRCVLEAAEFGLAIDGRLAHAVARNNKVKGPDGKDLLVNGKATWQKEASFMPDYKGIIAVARRNKIVSSCDADVICENDEYEFWKDMASFHFRHRKPLGPRGKVLGAYARLILPDGDMHVEEMNLEELNHVQAKSSAKDRDGNSTGPWVTDTNEMRKKTVLKRGLKYYADDSAIIRLIEADDKLMVESANETQDQAVAMPKSGQRMNLRQSAAVTHQPTIPAPWEQNGQVPEYEPMESDAAQPETQAALPNDSANGAPSESVMMFQDCIDACETKQSLKRVREKLESEKADLGAEYPGLAKRLMEKMATVPEF